MNWCKGWVLLVGGMWLSLWDGLCGVGVEGLCFGGGFFGLFYWAGVVGLVDGRGVDCLFYWGGGWWLV